MAETSRHGATEPLRLLAVFPHPDDESLGMGPGGEGCVRINFATPRSVLEEALGRIKRALS